MAHADSSSGGGDDAVLVLPIPAAQRLPKRRKSAGDRNVELEFRIETPASASRLQVRYRHKAKQNRRVAFLSTDWRSSKAASIDLGGLPFCGWGAFDR